MLFPGKERYIDAGEQPGGRADGLMIESFLVNRRLVSSLKRMYAPFKLYRYVDKHVKPKCDTFLTNIFLWYEVN